MASGGYGEWSNAAAVLTGLDPSVVGYIRQMESKKFSTKKYDEAWEDGNTECTVAFQSEKAKAKFNKDYDHYCQSLVKASLNGQNMCKGLISMQISNITRRRRDLCVRLIDDQIVFCGTQKTVDDEFGPFEYEIMRQSCDKSCSVCGVPEVLGATGADGVYIAEWGEDQQNLWQQKKAEEISVEYSHSFEMSGSSRKENPRKTSILPSPFMKEKMKGSRVKKSKKSSVGFYVYCADLIRMNVDALVCPVDQSISLTWGIGKAVIQAAGRETEAECERHKSRLGLLKEGQAIAVTGGKLYCHCVILVNPGYRQTSDLTEEQITLAVSAALEQVINKGLSTVALPLIGSGKGGASTLTSIKAVCRALEEHIRRPLAVDACHVVGQDKKQIEKARKKATMLFLSKSCSLGSCFRCQAMD